MTLHDDRFGSFRRNVMAMTAEMVKIERPPLTLDQMPFWSECQVALVHSADPTVYSRFRHPSGTAARIDSEGFLLRYGPASEYAVKEILGPKPANNDQLRKAGNQYMDEGMSLRDWFAGQADKAWDIYQWVYGHEAKDTPEGIAAGIAEIRCMIADAMLAELAKEADND